MTVENRGEQREDDQGNEIIEVEPNLVNALRQVDLPNQEQGGCTIMPRKYLVSADEMGLRWDMDTVIGMVEASQEHVWEAKHDLADLFGRVMLGLRAGRGVTIGIRKYPIITRITK